MSAISSKKSQHEAGTTKSGLLAECKDLSVIVEGQTVAGDARIFQDGAGSVGWYFNGKVQVTLKSGKKVWVQFGGNATIIGSKELPKDAPAA